MMKSNPDLIEQQLIQGLDPNVRGRLGVTPLIHAVTFNKTKIISLLLEYGANPLASHRGTTPLSSATSFETVKLLVKAGVKPRTEYESALVSVTTISEETSGQKSKLTDKNLEQILVWLKKNLGSSKRAVPKEFL